MWSDSLAFLGIEGISHSATTCEPLYIAKKQTNHKKNLDEFPESKSATITAFATLLKRVIDKGFAVPVISGSGSLIINSQYFPLSPKLSSYGEYTVSLSTKYL